MACFLKCVPFNVTPTITDKPTSKEGSLAVSGVTRYSWDDVEALTSNFSRLIGSGGYSSIYMARLSSSAKAALKVHVSSHRLYKIFKLELDILLRLHHPNIVKLLGYFDDSGTLMKTSLWVDQACLRINVLKIARVIRRFIKDYCLYECLD